MERRSVTKTRYLVPALAACVLLASESPVQAENIALNEETGLFIAEGVLLFVATIPGIVAATGNATLAARGERPSLAWHLLGWTTGGVNTGVGLLFTIAGATTDRTALWIAGLSHLGLGVATLALTFWGWTLPKEIPVVVGPYIGFDVERGAPKLVPRGLSLSITTW